MSDDAEKKPRKPRKRRRKAKKLPMPKGLAELADEAILEHYERPCAPRILIEKNDRDWGFACPYDQENEDRWVALLFQAFGTRSNAIMQHFLNTFAKLVGDGEWDDDLNCWMPKQQDFDAIVAIVHSLKPENEAQAAHAAQLCALHLSAMRLGEQANKHYSDARTAAILNKTVRAYGEGLERFARLQGKLQPRSIHQTFEVHKHEHIHFEGGHAPNGGQPYGADGRAAAIQTRPALPSPQSGGAALPLPSGEGQASVPVAWWGKRLWRAFWRT